MADRPIDAIERWRKAHGMSKVDMALSLGLHITNYIEAVAGKRTLTHWRLVLAYRLGVPANLLLQFHKPIDLEAKISSAHKSYEKHRANQRLKTQASKLPIRRKNP